MERVVSRRRHRRAAAATAATVLGATLAVATASATAAAATISPTGSVLLTLRGNGHGHGMSQYGARGAAVAGLGYQQILAFYYPGARLVTAPRHYIRIRLSATGSATTILASSHTAVTGVAGELPTQGVARYRLVADAGSGLTLQKLGTAPGSRWQTVRTGLPDGTGFHRTNWASQRLLRDGASTAYLGTLRAVRVNPTGTAGGVRTVNRLLIDNYTAGVVPREMPASWPAQAVNAQAVAARTYGAFAIAHPAGSYYDICDTTMCQVYGGRAQFTAAGAIAYTDYRPAARATRNQVLEYKGQPIFAQFSASNGGWTVDGGQPYLAARVDPYDTRRSGDPYLGYTQTVTARSIAKWFGLATLTGITVTQRDGNGAWGGRVLTATITGTSGSGAARKLSVTGFELQAAFGVGTTWMSVAPAP